MVNFGLFILVINGKLAWSLISEQINYGAEWSVINPKKPSCKQVQADAIYQKALKMEWQRQEA